MQHEQDGQCGEHAEDRRDGPPTLLPKAAKEHEEELGDHEIAKPVGGGSRRAADAARAEGRKISPMSTQAIGPQEKREAKDIDGNQNHGQHGQSGYIAGEVEDGKRRKRNRVMTTEPKTSSFLRGTCPCDERGPMVAAKKFTTPMPTDTQMA